MTGRQKITRKLKEMGFSEPIELYFWKHDGWYAWAGEGGCELMHDWIGQNVSHVLERLRVQSLKNVQDHEVPHGIVD